MEKTLLLAFLVLLVVVLVVVVLVWPEQLYQLVVYMYGSGDTSGASSDSELGGRAVASEDRFITSLRLYEGWNLISTPLVLDYPNVSVVFMGADFNIVYSWDADSRTWLYHIPSLGGNLTYIEVDRGYWIHVSKNTTITLYGRAPYPLRNVSLAAGWNLVGFSGYNTLPLSAALEGVDYVYVCGWNTARAMSHSSGVGWSFKSIYGKSVYSTPPKPQLMKDSGFTDADVLTVMEQGRGYWIYVEKGQHWAYETGYPA